MNDPIMIRAREMALASKRWGRHPEDAIRTGQWDNGNVVQQHVDEATVQLLREREEADGE